MVRGSPFPQHLLVFEAIYRKSSVLDAVILQLIDVPPGTMASAAEINRGSRRQASRIESHAWILPCTRTRGSYVCRAWALPSQEIPGMKLLESKRPFAMAAVV